MPTVTGSVPPTVDPDAPRDGFGRTVLASPFGMALVAATVAAGNGSWLIAGRPTAVEAMPRDPARRWSTRCVRAVGDDQWHRQGDRWLWRVFSKTSEADSDGSHSWFAGTRGIQHLRR